jgi:hypothetical protein
VRTFVFLHVLTMILAVSASGGAEILVHRVVGTRDLAGIRSVVGTYEAMARFVPVLFFTGLAFGVVAIFVEGFNPFQPWLLLAYVLFASGVLVGAIVNGGWVRRLGKAAAAAASPDDAAYQAAVADQRGRIGLFVFWVLIAAIVFVMIVKPLS